MDHETDEHRFRARENVPGDYVQTLLNSLTLDQIRDAAYLLAPGSRVTVRSHAGTRAALAQTHRSNEDICKQLLNLEAQQPFKHCLFFKCTGEPNLGELQNFVNQSIEAQGFHFRVAHVLNTSSALIVTVEHSVEVKEWVKQEDEDVKRLTTFETRHPIVLRVLKTSKIGSLNYPGFSQGQGTKREKILQYDSVLKALLKIIGEWGLAPRVLSVKESLRVLLAGGNSRVHRFRADVEVSGVGRFDLASSRKDITVEESLLALLKLEATEAEKSRFIESARTALNDADTNFAVLFWQQEKVITRLKFWDIGCEIFFVWSGERQSYDIVEPIIEILAGAHERIGTWVNSQTIPLQWLSSLPPGTIKQPVHLAEALNLEPASARAEMMYGVKAGLLVPVYRLSTNELIPDHENNWTPALSNLRRVFETDSGISIDGTDPKMIEVAFQRVAELVETGN